MAGFAIQHVGCNSYKGPSHDRRHCEPSSNPGTNQLFLHDWIIRRKLNRLSKSELCFAVKLAACKL
jgi:hypothetical protein